MAYIGFFPVTAGFTAVNFRMTTATKKTESASGRIIRATNSTTKWKGTLQYPPVSYEEFLPIQAFVGRCQGPLNEFDIVIPELSTHNPHPTQLTYVRADATAGSSSVLITSDQINKTNLLQAGDHIRFPNHTKVYMVTEDVVTDGSGNGTINFTPGLVQAVNFDSTGDTIIVNNVPFRMILTNDIQEFGYRNDGYVSYEIDVEEVV
jgi:hypothetical protein